MLIYNEFVEHAYKHFPYWKEALTKNPLSPYLFASDCVKLETANFQKIKNFIFGVYELRNNPTYIEHVLGGPSHTEQKSVLMSFDFHITPEGPKLIEINTNASHFLTSFIFSHYAAEKLKQKLEFENALEGLKSSFFKEMELFDPERKFRSIGILDEDPALQKAFTEFLMYHELFEGMGLSSQIYNISDLKYNSEQNVLIDYNDIKVDFIYNRYTDFYLSEEKSKELEKAYDNKGACFSPTPQEYQLLSDKNRLLDFCKLDYLKTMVSEENANSILACALEIFNINNVPKEELWARRKKYFFKPMTSHGSKGVYDGSKITHNTFDQIYATKHYLAQQTAAPQKTEILVNGKPQEAKYDLRFFVYNGVIQHMIARTYIGQTTNFKTLGGGFSPVFLK